MGMSSGFSGSEELIVSYWHRPGQLMKYLRSAAQSDWPEDRFGKCRRLFYAFFASKIHVTLGKKFRDLSDLSFGWGISWGAA